MQQLSLFADVPATDLQTKPARVDQWSVVRIPTALRRRLEAIRENMESHYQRTGKGLPDKAEPGAVALHFAIEKAVTEYEQHLERSRQAAARRRKS